MSDAIRVSISIGGFGEGTPDVDFSMSLPNPDKSLVGDLIKYVSDQATKTFMGAQAWTATETSAQ